MHKEHTATDLINQANVFRITEVVFRTEFRFDFKPGASRKKTESRDQADEW